MVSPELIFKVAKSTERKIGIGVGSDEENVESSVTIANASKYGVTTMFDDAEELVQALKKGEIDAAVRGTLDSKDAMSEVKRSFGLDHVLRVALMQPRGGSIFFLAPVGVDEGWTVEQKVEIMQLGSRMIRRMGVVPAIGVLSGGRLSDKGRSPVVDRSIDDAEEVARIGRAQGLDAIHCEILIEEAVKRKNFIIAPDGISGNLIFRTMHLVDGGRSMGAPIVNLDKVFVDTSRAKVSFVDSIALASALLGDPSARSGHPGGHPGGQAGGHPGGHPGARKG
ncbi:MAG TPA: methanogenesis marker protein Mmp4/MtxX [Methanomassiliicoccales archaeon]|jgi:putative methanogen marker protein 4